MADNNVETIPNKPTEEQMRELVELYKKEFEEIYKEDPLEVAYDLIELIVGAQTQTEAPNLQRHVTTKAINPWNFTYGYLKRTRLDNGKIDPAFIFNMDLVNSIKLAYKKGIFKP